MSAFFDRLRRSSRQDGPEEEHQAPTSWDLPQDPHQGVYVTGPVFERTLPVLLVVHDDDGDLQFVDNVHDVDAGTSRLVCLHHALEGDAALPAVVRSLPVGHAAQRESVGGTWQVWRQAAGD